MKYLLIVLVAVLLSGCSVTGDSEVHMLTFGSDNVTTTSAAAHEDAQSSGMTWGDMFIVMAMMLVAVSLAFVTGMSYERTKIFTKLSGEGES